MKLIQILGLATVIASAGFAQSTATGNPIAAPQTKPSPAPATQQKVVAKKGHKKTSAPGAKTPSKPAAAAGKTTPASQPGTAKKATPSSGSGSHGAAASSKNGSTSKTPAVQTGTLPVKKTGAHTAATNSATANSASHNPSATGAAKTAAKPAGKAKSVTPAASAAAKPKSTARKTVVATAPKSKKTAGTNTAAAKVTGTAPATVPEKKPAPRLIGSAGRRDPFVSPIRSASEVTPTQSCASGKRCLAIPELILQGTVRDITGKMMAVVSTSNRRTYTLRENDQVFNGSVEKITSDSIIFREYVKDALGRESAKEVVKKLGPTS